ncbi:MAG TPA: OmpA family protein [Chitinophagaceae bacterium]|nr:OmpA family protein [Chitinophagaceae bacterium]
MKKLLLFITVFCCIAGLQAQINIKDKIKNKALQKADEKTDRAIDKGFEKAEDAARKTDKPTAGEAASGKASTQTTGVRNKDTVAPASNNNSFKAYQNYDFIPGEKIIFEDNFAADADGEFPAHWKLVSGQAVINKVNGEPSFVLTDGNYAKVTPRMKSPAYLGKSFTIEFDYYVTGSDYGAAVFFTPSDDSEDKILSFSKDGETTSNFPENGLNGTTYPSESQEAYYNKWHHIAIAFKNGQLKCYLDQHRVLVIPSAEFTPVSVKFGGIAPIRIRNVRIAEGGGMNMLDKLTADGKIITHGITFDVNKATIRPESMGTLNMIVKIMTDKPDIKFEVGGHTDSDGEDAYNMKLSQQRADAVRNELVKMGINTSRLTAKGYGEGKPLNDNNSPESKANNRRVEFTVNK